jgi:regulator of protease activity HflC (stomatin/prohibitin superfamily)
MDVLMYTLAAVAVVGAAGFSMSARVVKQIERGVVFRLGRVQKEPRPPGFTMIVPVVDRMKRVNVQVMTMPVPA